MQLKQDNSKMEKITILNERKNPLFNRIEIESVLETDIIPKMQEAEEIISKKLSSNEGSVKIKKISGKFGSKEFIITANIYNSREDKEKTEAKSKKEKAAKAEEKKE